MPNPIGSLFSARRKKWYGVYFTVDKGMFIEGGYWHRTRVEVEAEYKLQRNKKLQLIGIVQFCQPVTHWRLMEWYAKYNTPPSSKEFFNSEE